MPTVCRYIVVRVDASLATITPAEENCCHAATTGESEQSAVNKPDNSYERRDRRIVFFANLRH